MIDHYFKLHKKYPETNLFIVPGNMMQELFSQRQNIPSFYNHAWVDGFVRLSFVAPSGKIIQLTAEPIHEDIAINMAPDDLEAMGYTVNRYEWTNDEP